MHRHVMKAHRWMRLWLAPAAVAVLAAAWLAHGARAKKGRPAPPPGAAHAAAPLERSIEEIVCFSDSAEGAEVAQAAARFLAGRGQQRFYSKSFVAIDRGDKESNRYLILVLSPEGDRAFDTERQGFDDALLALLQKMKKHFEDNRVEVILQHPDKSNMMEAYFDEKGGGALKGFLAPSPTPTGPGPMPAAPPPLPHAPEAVSPASKI